MKQLTTIQTLQNILPQVNGVDVALLYGSFGRNEATPNSDIDIQLLVDNDFRPKDLTDVIRNHFQTEIQFVKEVALRNKIVVYFSDQPKIEFAICTSTSEIDKHYLGSEITEVTNTILFEKQPSKFKMRQYLNQLIENNTKQKGIHPNDKQTNELIEKFLYEYESCSTMHRRSDGYQFYFFYNIALQVAIQLNQLSKGQHKFSFLPKGFIANVLTKEEQQHFYDLKGNLYLPEANKQKRRLLDFFYSSIEKLATKEKQEEVRQFCEWIYSRDYFWNFRDISTHNPRIKTGIIYRTATMSLFENESSFDALLTSKNIKTVIDLRAEQEVADLPYNSTTQGKFRYITTPFDPWNQPDWFVKAHHQGTNEEIAYRYFGIGCNDQIKIAMQEIINERNGSVAIHCFAGKDRTGILVSLLHLLAESPIESVYADYLASEADVNVVRLNIVLDIVNEKGGIEPYLTWCGLSENLISQLKQKIVNP